MTSVSLEDFRTDPEHYLAEVDKGDVILTRDGMPWAVLRTVADDQDRLSTLYSKSAEFWQMIQERRQERSIPWEQARGQLELD